MIIRAKGSCRVVRPAELATLLLTVEHEHSDASASSEATHRLAGELRDDLAAVPPPSLASLAVGAPRTATRIPYAPDGTPGPAQFVTAIELRATFSSIDALNAITARWGARAGVSLAPVEWSLTDATRLEAEDEALRAAVALAAHRAEVMALASGVGALELRELGDPAVEAPAPMVARFAKAQSADAGSVPASGDDVVVEAAVEAVYEGAPVGPR